MKRFLKILIVVVFVITSSCAPQKINIIGKQGTEIYSYDMQIIAEILIFGNGYFRTSAIFYYHSSVNDQNPKLYKEDCRNSKLVNS